VKCYVHAKEGSAVDAVAVCVVCGMGVCMEHAVERDLPVRTSAGLAGYPERGMLILCPVDAKARAGG
jgi:hypothetical protein